MKIVSSSIIVILVFLVVCSCASIGGGGGNQQDPSWAGMYSGVLPTADCPGISMVIILNADSNDSGGIFSDGAYKITYYYIDRDEELFTFTGKLSWDRAAKLITLDSNYLPSYYRAGKGSLTQLDMEGKEITGKLAEYYKLRKVTF